MAVMHIDFLSRSIGRIIPMVAIVPVERPPFPGVENEPLKPFRSLYLLHGYNGGESDWIRGSRIGELALQHKIAVFMPAGENSFYLDDEIRGAFYSKLVCEELIEFTRTLFPLSDKREDTFLGGFSMGGYGALRNGLYRGDVFGGVVALSSAILVDTLPHMKPDMKGIAPYSYYTHTFGDLQAVIGSDKDPKALAKKIIDENLPKPALFLACGTEDFGIKSNKDYSDYLNEIGFEHEYHATPGIHNWTFWDEYIEKALNWIDGLYK